MLSEASGFSRVGGHRANIRPSSRPRTAAVPKPEKEGRSLEPGIGLRAPYPCTHVHMHAALFCGVAYRSETGEYVKAVSRSFTFCLPSAAANPHSKPHSTTCRRAQGQSCVIPHHESPHASTKAQHPTIIRAPRKRVWLLAYDRAHGAEWNVRKQGEDKSQLRILGLGVGRPGSRQPGQPRAAALPDHRVILGR